MAKKKYQIAKGIISVIINGVKKPFTDFQKLLDDMALCCGVSCCENVLRLQDKDTGETMVGYFFGGAWVVETETAYQAKKENGDFNY